MKIWCLFIDESKKCGFLQLALIPESEGENTDESQKNGIEKNASIHACHLSFMCKLSSRFFGFRG